MVAVAFHCLSRVHSDSGSDHRFGRPFLGADCRLQSVGGAHGVAGSSEHRERRIALTARLEQGACLGDDRLGHQLFVASEGRRHGVGALSHSSVEPTTSATAEAPNDTTPVGNAATATA